MLALLAAMSLGEALGKVNEIENAMTDCALGVEHYCQQLTTDEYERDLNDLVIFQGQFKPQSDAELDEWNEALRNLQNAARDADERIRGEDKK